MSVLLCTKCGGPLPAQAAKSAVTCQFCGTTSVPPPEVVVVGRINPIAIAPGVHEDPRLPCPRCADFLTETRVRETVLSACKSCGGVWLDARTVERLKQARDEDVDQAARRIAAREISGMPPDRTLSIACPVCRNHLRRVAIDGEVSHAVDVCDAHGTWFDRGDADELSLFIAAYESVRAGEYVNANNLRPAGVGRGVFARLFGSR